MSTARYITHFARDAENVSVHIVTDPAGRSETPPLPKPRVAVHLGNSVFMACERAGQRHRGLAVHGDIDIVPAETPCVWEPNGPDTALIVSIEPELLAAAADELGLKRNRLEVVNRFQIRDRQVEHICWALKAEMEAGYPTGRTFLDGLSTALAAALVRRHSSLAAIPFHSNTTMSGHRLRQAISYIEDNLKQNLSLGEIAGAAGLSVSHLKTTFRQLTGVPVHQYVIQRRVERAGILLAQGRLSISEVAQEAGFAHQSHLAKHMQRILSCSPKAFRAYKR
ncbi:MAG: AraC family transcriptional regulator [Acidobacteriota bacterium]|nr:AraC family transcriptional regulator [Acidobacteriota bacterium]